MWLITEETKEDTILNIAMNKYTAVPVTASHSLIAESTLCDGQWY